MKKTGIVIVSMVISTGLLLAPVGLPALQYNCSGGEVFPVYTASPFIYRSTSLATSMAHDYYATGFITDILIWAFILFFLNELLMKFVFSNGNKIFLRLYSGIKWLMVILSLFFMALELQTEGQSLRPHINLEQEASAWGMQCSPEWTWEH